MSHPIADDYADIAARMKGALAPLALAQHDGPNSELLRLHRALAAQREEVARIEAEGADLPGDITPARMDQERRLAEANDVWWEIFDEIADTPALGLAGQRAKAARMRLVVDRGLQYHGRRDPR